MSVDWRSEEYLDSKRTMSSNHTTNPEEYHELLNSIKGAAHCFKVDGEVTFWNKASEVLYGFTSAEAVGRNVIELLSMEATYDTAAQILTRLQMGESWSGGFPMRKKSGEVFKASITNTPIFDSYGNIAIIIALTADTRKLKDAPPTETPIFDAEGRPISTIAVSPSEAGPIHERQRAKLSSLKSLQGEEEDLAEPSSMSQSGHWALSSTITGLAGRMMRGLGVSSPSASDGGNSNASDSRTGSERDATALDADPAGPHPPPSGSGRSYTLGQVRTHGFSKIEGVPGVFSQEEFPPLSAALGLVRNSRGSTAGEAMGIGMSMGSPSSGLSSESSPSRSSSVGQGPISGMNEHAMRSNSFDHGPRSGNLQSMLEPTYEEEDGERAAKQAALRSARDAFFADTPQQQQSRQQQIWQQQREQQQNRERERAGPQQQQLRQWGGGEDSGGEGPRPAVRTDRRFGGEGDGAAQSSGGMRSVDGGGSSGEMYRNESGSGGEWQSGSGLQVLSASKSFREREQGQAVRGRRSAAARWRDRDPENRDDEGSDGAPRSQEGNRSVRVRWQESRAQRGDGSPQNSEYASRGSRDGPGSFENTEGGSAKWRTPRTPPLPRGRSDPTRSESEPTRLGGNNEARMSAAQELANEKPAGGVLRKEWSIPWEDLEVLDEIGNGASGTVFKGLWEGSDVAIKVFGHHEMMDGMMEEFEQEIGIMQRLRHPNVLLFMGAVCTEKHLCIVTEFLPRGSLFKQLHRSKTSIPWPRRLRMALDVAQGMNYLHNAKPPIVHRDLKSPNLLVDYNWTVKVGDFGLSKTKHATFLTAKSGKGTPQWMAPEVLRNEYSNEKADVYSFAIILWELAMEEPPWNGLNPMQVVGAVGYMEKRPPLSDKLDPQLAQLITDCWKTDPRERPPFEVIVRYLKVMQKPLTSSATPTGGDSPKDSNQESPRRATSVNPPPDQGILLKRNYST
eukprot:TRINITY_DN11321_c0_g1_i2.p1 TRINITY_DN11321_c0_g1~~TRINITY_DN11321_c0_g1_i2.p1  ORF type:complete len:960 (-),score=191.25 TRINITY_DN11321_c0_g1_i2:934-3813(-)